MNSLMHHSMLIISLRSTPSVDSRRKDRLSNPETTAMRSRFSVHRDARGV